MTTSLQTKLVKRFADAEYAQDYMNLHVTEKLAAQIYRTRLARGWTQEQLAERSGIAQPRISKLEKGEVDSVTMSTVRKFAKAFDVTISVELQSFAAGIRDVCAMKDASLVIPDRTASLQTMAGYHVLTGNTPSLPASTVMTGHQNTATLSSRDPAVALAP